jgi:hypothetical protein
VSDYENCITGELEASWGAVLDDGGVDGDPEQVAQLRADLLQAESESQRDGQPGGEGGRQQAGESHRAAARTHRHRFVISPHLFSDFYIRLIPLSTCPFFDDCKRVANIVSFNSL